MVKKENFEGEVGLKGEKDDRCRNRCGWKKCSHCHKERWPSPRENSRSYRDKESRCSGSAI
jgi:hypothetical protein